MVKVIQTVNRVRWFDPTPWPQSLEDAVSTVVQTGNRVAKGRRSQVYPSRDKRVDGNPRNSRVYRLGKVDLNGKGKWQDYACGERILN